MKMTWKKLMAWIAAGYGQGHYDEYKPFLQNTRRNTSAVSNQSAGNWLPGYTRRFHYQSRAERQIALGLLWLGGKDIREGFPMWPMTHHHPLAGTRGTESLRLQEVPGLWELAREAGIAHGVFPGTRIPYVATLDFMVTVHRGGTPDLVAISCKPRQQIFSADAASRMLERMELERLYCQTLSIPLCVADAKVFGRRLIANLEWMVQPQSLVDELATDTSLRRFLDKLEKHIYESPISTVLTESASSVGWSVQRAQQAFRFLAWCQVLDINLSEPVVMSHPATRGGIHLRKAMQRAILGEIDEEQF